MTSRRIAGIVVVLLVVLAGCSGGSPTTSPAETTAENQSVPSASDLQRETLSALAAVESYTAQQNATLRQSTADGNQTTTIVVEYAVNRSNRAVESHRTTTLNGQDVVVDRYVVDETLYQRSDQFVQRYGSEWIKQGIDGFDRQWHLYDQLWRYKYMLGNATLSDVERDRIDGTAVFVVTADVDTEAYNIAVREALGLPPGSAVGVGENASLSATFWIDTQTNRPIKVQRTLTGTQTIQEQLVDVERTITTRLGYEPVTVSLPEEARSAKDVNED